MKRSTKYALLDAGLLTAGVGLLAMMCAGCTRTVYVDGPTPVATPALPAPVADVCKSAPRSQGDCSPTSQDVYLAEYTTAVEAAKLDERVVWHGEVINGAGYIGVVIANLRAAGLCAGIYENEEVAVWSKADQSFSENWDTIVEPGGNAPLRPREGAGAHSYTCHPATTESGS